ncbi:MAG: hypothetical protein O6650_08835 [Actinobacteria bacterium]|nr:hypothetical protein [Actinomycetota bacterium]
MNDPTNQSFWERLAARTRASGALETIEDPMTIVRLATATLFASAVVAGLGGLFMVLFDEPAAGVAYLVLGASFLVAWVFYAATGDTRSTELIARSTLDNLYRFIIPALAEPYRVVPIAALATSELNVAALRMAAARGRLKAQKGSDGQLEEFLGMGRGVCRQSLQASGRLMKLVRFC